MKTFGLEIRKSNTIAGVFEDVDAVLEKYNIPSKGVSQSMQVQAVAHSLQKMMKAERHFSICSIRDCVKVCQVHISSERMNIYESQHCVDWNEMAPDFRNALIAMVLDDFREVLETV